MYTHGNAYAYERGRQGGGRSDSATLVHISGKLLEFVCQTADALLYISRTGCHLENSNFGPADLSGVAPEWHDPWIVGGYVTRLCNRACERVPRYTYIFFAVFRFVFPPVPWPGSPRIFIHSTRDVLTAVGRFQIWRRLSRD